MSEPHHQRQIDRDRPDLADQLSVRGGSHTGTNCRLGFGVSLPRPVYGRFQHVLRVTPCWDSRLLVGGLASQRVSVSHPRRTRFTFADWQGEVGTSVSASRPNSFVGRLLTARLFSAQHAGVDIKIGW